MRNGLAKTALSALVGIGLATAVATAPAEAQYFHGGGGWHGGGGGWHGGGWGGGWHGGYWNGGWRGGYWGGGYPGWGWGGGWGYPWWGWGAPVVVAGGAYYAEPGDGCWVYRRIWSQPGGRGRYLGRHLVNICQ